MASKTAERLCTGIGRTLVLLSITLGVRDPSQTGEEQVEPQLHPVAEEQPQEQPPEVVEATGSGEGQAVPVEGEAEVAGEGQAVPVEGEAEVAGEGQAVPEEQELEEQRQESKGDRSSQVSKDASTMTEEIPGDVWFTLISSLESLEETTKKRRRKQEWPKAVAGTSSQFAREGQVLPKYKELEKKKQAICEDSSSSTEEELPAPTIMVKISSPSRSSAEVKMEVRGRKRKLESPKVVAGTSSQFAKEGQVLSKYKKLEKKKQAICEERSSSSTEEELPARSIVFTVSSPSRSSEEVKLELRERKRKQALPEAQAGPSSQLTPSHEEAEGGDREKEEEEEEEEKEEQASTERPVACPMRKVPEMRCTWKGQIGDLKEHISKIHRRVLRPGNRFTSPSRTYCVQLVWCYDEVFLFYKYISADGVMSAFLQQVGISTSQFVCRMEVLSHSGLVPDTLNTFIVPQMSRYFRAICNDESCLTIDSGFIDYFVSNGEMDMSLQITRADQILESGVLEGEIPGTPPEEQEVGSDEEKIKCPLFKVAPFHCPVSEPATSLVEHLLSKHRYILIQEPEFDCEHVAIRVLLILFDNEVFLYYKHISQTSMHVLVQQVGLTNEKYKFRIELSAWDAEDNINFTGNATSIDEDFETVFNTYDCLTINLDNLDKFATNSDIDMKVKITRANTP